MRATQNKMRRSRAGHVPKNLNEEEHKTLFCRNSTELMTFVFNSSVAQCRVVFSLVRDMPIIGYVMFGSILKENITRENNQLF